MGASVRPPVDFEMASVVVEQERLRGDHALLSSQVNQQIQNLTGSVQAMQGDLRHLADKHQETNELLHEMRERSSGLERLASALEKGGGLASGEIKALQLSVAEWKGFIKAVALCGGLALTAVAAYGAYRFDAQDREIERVREDIRAFHGPNASR